MKGGKKEMITLRDILYPGPPSYTNSDLEKQFQEVTTKIFENQKKHIYPEGDSNLFVNIPQHNFNYQIDRKYKQKQEINQRNNYILKQFIIGF